MNFFSCFFSLIPALLLLSSCTTMPKLDYSIKQKINGSVYNLSQKSLQNLNCKITTNIFNSAAKAALASKVVSDKEFRILNNYYIEVVFSPRSLKPLKISLDPIPKLENSLGEARYRPYFSAVEKIIESDMTVLNSIFMLPILSEKVPHYLVKETDKYYEIESKSMSVRSYIVYKDFSKIILPLEEYDSLVTAKITKEGKHNFITSFETKSPKKDFLVEYFFNYSTTAETPLPLAVIVQKKDFDIELAYNYSLNNCRLE